MPDLKGHWVPPNDDAQEGNVLRNNISIIQPLERLEGILGQQTGITC